MRLLDQIKRDYPDAQVGHCGEAQTRRVALGPGTRALVFKGERLASAGKSGNRKSGRHCDCIIIFSSGEELRVAVVENKKANIKATQAIEQIENCLMLARRLLAQYARHCNIVYRLAIYAQGGWYPSDVKRIEDRNRRKNTEPPIQRRKYNMNIQTLFEGGKI